MGTKSPGGGEVAGLREISLVALPHEAREHLREIVEGVYRLAATWKLLYSDPDLPREQAEMVGLWRDLEFLRGFASHMERRATGERREGVRDIRVLLEKAVSHAKQLVPEGLS